MPKIRSHFAYITVGGTRNTINFDIMYVSKYGFYISVPGEFLHISENIADAQYAGYGLSWYSSKGRSYILTVRANTEEECVKQYAAFITLMKEVETVTIPVIIVSYRPHQTMSYSTIEDCNSDHAPDGFTLSLTYCDKITVGKNKPVYKMPGKTRTISVYNNQKIIPDTPENRRYVETLYTAVVELRKKLEALTESSESIQQFISSNQKLLS